MKISASHLARSVALAICLITLTLSSASAATLTVTTTNDSGAGSLRQAVISAAAGDAIAFALPGGAVIRLTSGQIAVTKDLTIAGPGADRLTISGNNASRIFFLPIGVTAKISRLTLIEGSQLAGDGGAMFCDNATLYLTSCVVKKSKAARGGGLGLHFSTIYMAECTFNDNVGTASGGAIFCNEGSVIMSGSAFYNNSGALVGGALHNLNGTFDLTNCTLSQNLAARGGAIYNERGTIFSHNVTIAKNCATVQTGGILNVSGGTVFLANTILAKNTAPANPDLFGDGFSQQDSLGGTLLGNGTDSQLNSFGIGDQVGTAAAPIDPNLGPIQDNGGPTWTMALRPGSRAINTGRNELAVDAQTFVPLTTDQRGFSRFVGQVDIGAFEYFTAHGYKNEALFRLPTKSTGDAKLDCYLARARTSIECSLNACYWVDGLHLSWKGSSVFCYESDAACWLMKVLACNSNARDAVNLVLDALVEADRLLASTAIDEAAARSNCNRCRLDAARRYFAQAECFRSLGKFCEAISTYGCAWRSAREACNYDCR